MGFSRGTDCSDGFCLHGERGILQKLSVEGGTGTLADGHGSQGPGGGRKCCFFRCLEHCFCFLNKKVWKEKHHCSEIRCSRGGSTRNLRGS